MYSQLSLMDSMTHSEIPIFHDVALVTIMVILVSVVGYYVMGMKTSFYGLKVDSLGGMQEKSDMVWTILPIFILCSLSVPSLSLLYKMEWMSFVDLTYKVVSHQWYWSYSHSDATIDSYMLSEPALGDLRLLDVDNRLSAPYSAEIRFIVTSTDVIHAFSLPNFYVKVDAVPSRLNTCFLGSDVPGIAYGQCSEICSVNHSFMPICVEFVNWASFMENVASW